MSIIYLFILRLKESVFFTRSNFVVEDVLLALRLNDGQVEAHGLKEEWHLALRKFTLEVKQKTDSRRILVTLQKLLAAFQLSCRFLSTESSHEKK